MKKLFSKVLIITIAISGFAAESTRDLDDIDYSRITRKTIRPIGDLGSIECIVDLRTFVPIVLPSIKRADNFRESELYFKFPVREGVSLIYYWRRDVVPEIAKTPIIFEADVSSEQRKWVKLAYGLTRKELFELLGGRTGLNTAEPVLLLFTKTSVLAV